MVLSSFESELDVLLIPLLLSSVVFTEPASIVMLGEAVVELSAVRFTLGTSTHSVISTTASARSKESIPLLLREKWRVALMGEERFLAEYLEDCNKKKEMNNSYFNVNRPKPFYFNENIFNYPYFSLASVRPVTAY